MALRPELEGGPQLLRNALGRPLSGDHLGYANVQSKERFPHSHSLHRGCGISQSQTTTRRLHKIFDTPPSLAGLDRPFKSNSGLSSWAKFSQTCPNRFERCLGSATALYETLPF